MKLSVRKEVWSSGGGTQSCAIAVLIAKGILPKPDIGIMVDTEREVSAAIEYNKKHIVPLMESVGVRYEIVKKSDYTNHDLTNESGGYVLPPFFTNIKNEKGRQPSFCSGKWKTEPFQRRIREVFGDRVYFNVWVGMSSDELGRLRIGKAKYLNYYPLVELNINRGKAIKIVEDYGLPTPPRSACWMCPNRHDSEWQHLKDEYPDDFKKAIKFEKNLKEKYPHLSLHRDQIPIDEVQFTDGTMDMFSGCNSGMCFT